MACLAITYDAFFEDREGVIWCGGTAGLDSFSESQITPLSIREGSLPFNQNLSVQATSDGNVWVGSSPKGFVEIINGRTEFLLTEAG